jgi:hypothetical protein
MLDGDFHLTHDFLSEMFPQLSIYVPRCLILATGIFDQFMEDGGLHKIALSGETDETVVNAFLAVDLRAVSHFSMSSQF